MVSSLKLLKLLFTFRNTFYVINDDDDVDDHDADNDDDIGDDDNTYTANNKMINKQITITVN